MSVGRRTVLGSMLALALPSARAAIPVRYPPLDRNASAFRPNHPVFYPPELLQQALANSGRRYALSPAPTMMSQGRGLLELQSKRAIDVMWTVTSRQRESDLLPIRIPIDRGLLGWRLLLIRSEDVGRYRAIRNREQLAALRALQGHDWPDTEILRANQFQVQTAADYAGMFKMLASKRTDYFPRSSLEIWDEAEASRRDGLVVEDSLVLHYPGALYYFVRKDSAELAADIERGLERMLADGSFGRLFAHYHNDLLRQANLGGRRRFELRNPLLPETAPLGRRELWYRPEQGL